MNYEITNPLEGFDDGVLVSVEPPEDLLIS